MIRHRELPLQQVLDERLEGAGEDLGRVAGGDGVAQQVLRELE
jgi:hypothetical protein